MEDRVIKNRHGKSLGYGCCYRCGDTWDWKKGHTTYFDESRGCFPLCHDCWSRLTPEERLPYYERMVDSWLTEAVKDRNEIEQSRLLIRKAVLEEK